MKPENAGFYAIGTLVIVILYLGMRSVDDDGQLIVSRHGQVDAPQLVDNNGLRELHIKATPYGSFETEVAINGSTLDMLIDTGASNVVIPESEARLAGIRVGPNDYVHAFSTANGEVRAAQVQAERLAIGPAHVENMTIYVLPDSSLDQGLLGMDMLRRFGRVEMQKDQLILQLD